MKKSLFLFATLLSLQFNGFTQTTDTVTYTPSPRQTYLAKSKSQKTSAWVLLIGGTVFLTGGSAIASSNLSWGSTQKDSDYGLGMGMFFVGGAAMLSSIPLFIASARNKGRATPASAYLKLEDYQSISPEGLAKSNYPALSLRITIK